MAMGMRISAPTPSAISPYSSQRARWVFSLALVVIVLGWSSVFIWLVLVFHDILERERADAHKDDSKCGQQAQPGRVVRHRLHERLGRLDGGDYDGNHEREGQQRR